ncbi:MAG: fluoride efflux transporter CrcB [Crenarchaeota archaeon]|nr:fluoride efflux transporter CrcB [Thermoproteota archaeon]
MLPGPLRDLLLVGVGGFLGAVSRWILSKIVQDGLQFPIGTIVVNFLGCILLGFVLYSTIFYDVFTREQRLLIATGFAGSFTTFSTFSFEGFELWAEGLQLSAILYVAASLILGFIGIYIGRTLALTVYRHGL